MLDPVCCKALTTRDMMSAGALWQLTPRELTKTKQNPYALIKAFRGACAPFDSTFSGHQH